MLFKSALISVLLLAPAALANPHQLHRRFQSIERRDNYRHENAVNVSAATISGNDIHSATSTFTLPKLGGNRPGTAAVNVNIDLGDECSNSLVVSIVIGPTSYKATALFLKDHHSAKYFDQLSFEAGDQVKLSVTATSKTTGQATIENITKKLGPQTVTLAPQAVSASLCLSSGGVVVKPGRNEDGSVTPLLKFGTITVKNTEVTASSGALTFDNVSSQDVTLVNMLSGNGKMFVVKTSVRNGEVIFQQY